MSDQGTTMREITERAAAKHGVTPSDLRGRGTRKDVIVARCEAMAGCSAAGFSNRQIGIFFSDRDASSVWKAIQQHNAKAA